MTKSLCRSFMFFGLITAGFSSASLHAEDNGNTEVFSLSHQLIMIQSINLYAEDERPADQEVAKYGYIQDGKQVSLNFTSAYKASKISPVCYVSIQLKDSSQPNQMQITGNLTIDEISHSGGKSLYLRYFSPGSETRGRIVAVNCYDNDHLLAIDTPEFLRAFRIAFRNHIRITNTVKEDSFQQRLNKKPIQPL